MENGSPSNIILSYISSDKTYMSLDFMISVIARISSFVNVPPVGFDGVLSITNFVLSVIDSLNFSISILKSFSSSNGIGTGTPPTNFIFDSYIGNPGFG